MKKSNFNTVVFGFVGIGLVSLLAWIFINDKSGGPYLIAISKDNIERKIGKAGLAAWEIKNGGYYHGSPANPTNTSDPEVCGENILIDLSKISTNDGDKVRGWLRDNTDFICYKDSYEYIELSHRITDTNYQSRIDNATSKRKISFKKLKESLEPILKTDFDKHGYQGYINFFTVFDSAPLYNYDFGIMGEGRYSIPFFRSIRKKVQLDINPSLPHQDINSLDDKINLTFVKVKNADGIDAIAFRVDANEGGRTFTQYYNFSTDPGKITCMFY